MTAAAYPALCSVVADFFRAFPVIAFIVFAVSASGFALSVLDCLAVGAPGAVGGELLAA